MGEIERLANHFGDISAICNDASFALMHAHCAVLRERVLRAADEASKFPLSLRIEQHHPSPSRWQT
jgi:hypothetical protein